jgi:DNA-directed RNA polymerase subunit RPC12/RpoP
VASMLMDAEKKTQKRACPHCESTMVCRSRRHGVTESLLRVLSIVPFRCEECGKRFFAWAKKAGHPA